MNDGGSIVITSSVAATRGDPGVYAYITAKHAQIGLMRCLAKELAPRRIRVNTIHPGPIDNAFQLAVEKGLGEAIGGDGTAFFNELIPLAPPRQPRGDRPLRALSRLRSEQLHHRRHADGRRRHERMNLREMPPRRKPAAAGRNGDVRLGPLDNLVGFHLRLAQDASFRAFARHAGEPHLKPGRFAAMMVIHNNPGITPDRAQPRHRPRQVVGDAARPGAAPARPRRAACLRQRPAEHHAHG